MSWLYSFAQSPETILSLWSKRTAAQIARWNFILEKTTLLTWTVSLLQKTFSTCIKLHLVSNLWPYFRFRRRVYSSRSNVTFYERLWGRRDRIHYTRTVDRLESPQMVLSALNILRLNVKLNIDWAMDVINLNCTQYRIVTQIKNHCM